MGLQSKTVWLDVKKCASDFESEESKMIETAKVTMAPKKIVVRPSTSGQAQLLSTSNQGQIIVLPSNFLQQISSGNNTIKIPPASSSRPSIVVPASAAGLKRPSSSSSADEAPARKRANLDHMTPEEKLNRRKLKNRVAAQNARDKKKCKMDEIEEKLKALEEANAKLLLENESLRALNERLMSEKCQPLSVQTTSPYQAPPSLSPPPSEYSDRASSPGSASMSSSDCSLVDSRSFESAELIHASQQKSQDRGWAGLWTAVMATMAPAAFCLAAAAAASSPSSSPLPSLPNKETLSSKPLDTTPTSTKPVLPIKKRLIQTKEPPTT